MRPAVVLLLAVAACGTHRGYEGRARPRAEVARVEMTLGVVDEHGFIRTESGLTFVGVSATYQASVVAVDDRALSRASSVDVLPGPRSLLVEWKRKRATFFLGSGFGRRTTGEGRVRVPLDAQAGKRYRLEWGRIPPQAALPPSLKFRRIEG